MQRINTKTKPLSQTSNENVNSERMCKLWLSLSEACHLPPPPSVSPAELWETSPEWCSHTQVLTSALFISAWFIPSGNTQWDLLHAQYSARQQGHDEEQNHIGERFCLSYSWRKLSVLTGNAQLGPKEEQKGSWSKRRNGFWAGNRYSRGRERKRHRSTLRQGDF